jgi:hypothetical protein
LFLSFETTPCTNFSALIIGSLIAKDMLKKLDWLSVKQQIQIKTLKFVHGVVTNDKSNVFRDMYKINAGIHSINTRQSQNFHMFHQNNRTGQKSLFCNGLKIYNKLPQHIKLNKKSFKKEFIERTKKLILVKSRLSTLDEITSIEMIIEIYNNNTYIIRT